MPKCQLPTCDNEVEKTKSGKWKMHCSMKCRATHNSILGSEKRKQTCLEKYGSITNLKSNETKEKIKKTMVEKYGVEHPMFSDSIKDKMKSTIIEKYGVDNVSKSDVIKIKKIESYKHNFGVDHPLQSPIVQEKRKNACLQKYGVDHYSKTEMFKLEHPNQQHILPENYKKLKDKNWLEEHAHLSSAYIAEMLGVTKCTVLKSFSKFNIEKKCTHSSDENNILDFLKSIYNGNIRNNVRDIITPYEIDIFLPDLNLGIEFNGIFWHSELNGKSKDYHLNKTLMCEHLGIRLIHIFENEWINKESIIKSRLMNFLGNSNKVYARKCNIVKLNTVQQRVFFESSHIQGYTPSTICYGLELDGEIIAAMSFIKSRFNSKVKWELLRYSNKCFTTVVGGASRLFKHFLLSYSPENVISYSDRRWNTGNLYKTLGFTENSVSPPSYKYTKNYLNLESRIKYQKHKLKNILQNYDPNSSEWENMKSNGYDRIWDCGNKVFLWENKNY